MQRIFFFGFLMLLMACDDGDFVIDQLDFDDTDVQEPCLDGTVTLFKISEAKNEALIIQLEPNSVNFNKVDTLEFTINNNTNKVLYRIFDNEVTASYFCQSVPPTAPLVTEEWYAPSGTIRITTTVEDDDLDGVPTAEEGVVYNDDGTVNKAASRDSDGDGIPDYIDNDDDDDRVLTKDEIDNSDPTNIVYTNTDGDELPNYLDNDDDNDGVLTIDEDLNGDGNPTNDTVTIDGKKVPNYLTATAATTTDKKSTRRKNVYQSIYTSVIEIVDGFKLENENEEIKFDVDTYLFGTIENPIQQEEK
ncbi:hypothetical protein HX109_00430 [Galbibacter sp. BG1]|uniref:hypothetical protein n=1 Tax=Galbibacter sp. BG1 TaxID=1170699 RepID=UPI0015BA6C92|nr:hypothetical protein [Galbibacter sp. BG1]QLE00097.1 hypothetical protein HX109_00430 [Galbibacter sp. BG1]